MPDSPTDNPYRSPAQTSQKDPAPIQPNVRERRIFFGLGFAVVFAAALVVPVENRHSGIRPVSTLVSLGRYYVETLREVIHRAPSAQSSNSVFIFYSRFYFHLSASLVGGLLMGIPVHWGLDRLGFLERFRTLRYFKA